MQPQGTPGGHIGSQVQGHHASMLRMRAKMAGGVTDATEPTTTIWGVELYGEDIWMLHTDAATSLPKCMQVSIRRKQLEKCFCGVALYGISYGQPGARSSCIHAPHARQEGRRGHRCYWAHNNHLGNMNQVLYGKIYGCFITYLGWPRQGLPALARATSGSVIHRPFGL